MRDFLGEIVTQVAQMSGATEGTVEHELRVILEMIDHYEWVMLYAGDLHLAILWVLCSESYLETCAREFAEASLGPFDFKRTDSGVWLSYMTTEGFYPK